MLAGNKLKICVGASFEISSTLVQLLSAFYKTKFLILQQSEQGQEGRKEQLSIIHTIFKSQEGVKLCSLECYTLEILFYHIQVYQAGTIAAQYRNTSGQLSQQLTKRILNPICLWLLLTSVYQNEWLLFFQNVATTASKQHHLPLAVY